MKNNVAEVKADPRPHVELGLKSVEVQKLERYVRELRDLHVFLQGVEYGGKKRRQIPIDISCGCLEYVAMLLSHQYVKAQHELMRLEGRL